MLKIRFQRFGKKNQPTYRLVLIDSHRGPKSGNFLEILGSYNPRSKEKTLKEEKIVEWIGKGAKVSDTVNNFLIKNGVIKGTKIDVSAKKKSKNEEKSEETPKPDADESKAQTEEDTNEVSEDSAKESAEEISKETISEKTSGEKVDELVKDTTKEEAPTEGENSEPKLNEDSEEEKVADK